MNRDFSGCNAIVYTQTGDMVCTVKILSHDDAEDFVLVLDTPALKEIYRCDLLILTSPQPYTYKGTIHSHDGTSKRIGLYQEAEAENRREARFKVDLPVVVEHLLFDGKTFRLHTAIEGELLNISRGGLRFRARPDAFAVGNCFLLRIKSGDEEEKVLTTEVVNTLKVSNDCTEFGCLLGNKGGGQQ